MTPKKKSKTMKTKLISFTLLSPLPYRGGWGNGYVALPKNHPCFEMDYNTIHDQFSIDIHGGLTFSDSEIQGQPKETKGMWIVGFDTLHFGDTPQKWPNSKSVLKEANRLRHQLIKIAKNYDCKKP